MKGNLNAAAYAEIGSFYLFLLLGKGLGKAPSCFNMATWLSFFQLEQLDWPQAPPSGRQTRTTCSRMTVIVRSPWDVESHEAYIILTNRKKANIIRPKLIFQSSPTLKVCVRFAATNRTLLIWPSQKWLLKVKPLSLPDLSYRNNMAVQDGRLRKAVFYLIKTIILRSWGLLTSEKNNYILNPTQWDFKSSYLS